jgi:hypothetical protein
MALPANIKLGWKGLPDTNTLVYYKNPKITTIKSFIVQAPGGSTYKHWTCLKNLLGSNTSAYFGLNTSAYFASQSMTQKRDILQS